MFGFSPNSVICTLKVIICDTTALNTGARGGVVVLLKREFQKKGFPVPQYIGCQHHILDLVLKYVMNFDLASTTTSPEMNYTFVTELVENYKALVENFKQTTIEISIPSMKWRDDMNFLLELGLYYRYFTANGIFPVINFRILPNLSNARWNSRAIFVILAYILLPHYRERLQNICYFITGPWLDVWFSNHHYNMVHKQTLVESLHGYEKAKQCFLKHWIDNETAMDTARSNICAERGIKCIQEIMKNTKNPKNANKKFILYNKL